MHTDRLLREVDSSDETNYTASIRRFNNVAHVMRLAWSAKLQAEQARGIDEEAGHGRSRK